METLFEYSDMVNFGSVSALKVEGKVLVESGNSILFTLDQCDSLESVIARFSEHLSFLAEENSELRDHLEILQEEKEERETDQEYYEDKILDLQDQVHDLSLDIRDAEERGYERGYEQAQDDVRGEYEQEGRYEAIDEILEYLEYPPASSEFYRIPETLRIRLYNDIKARYYEKSGSSWYRKK